MAEKYDLAEMLKEIEEDKKAVKKIEKKWASQDDIKEMIKERKRKKEESID